MPIAAHALAALTDRDVVTPLARRSRHVCGRGPELDPFTPPADRQPIAELRPRDRVAIEGRVVSLSAVRWRGGTTFEVTLDDRTGCAVLAFLGRRSIAGFDLDMEVAAFGTVLCRADRRVLLNPYYWFLARAERP
jgi:hypothetical protein